MLRSAGFARVEMPPAPETLQPPWPQVHRRLARAAIRQKTGRADPYPPVAPVRYRAVAKSFAFEQPIGSPHGAPHLRPRERVRRHLHAARPAPAQPRRGGPLPVPPGRVAGAAARNVFLANGARLYLDVGCHPEYATPECDSIYDLVVHDKAGERILEQLLASAPSSACAKRASAASSTSSRTTPTPPATPTAATRTTSPSRRDDFAHYAEVLIPFLVSPPDLRRRGQGAADGAGRDVLHQPAGRAHLGGRVVSATTRSRPIINTRDEPHADAERFRRLHVIVGDSNMSEYATFLKVGATSILLRMLEEPERRAARHDAREPDPRHPRDQPRHHLPAPGAPGQRPRAVGASRSRREYLNRALRFAETQGLSPARAAGARDVGARAHRASRTTRSSSTASSTG